MNQCIIVAISHSRNSDKEILFTFILIELIYLAVPTWAK